MTTKVIKSCHYQELLLHILFNLDYSRAEANPPHPFIKVEEAACEGVVIYVEQAATKPMP